MERHACLFLCLIAAATLAGCGPSRLTCEKAGGGPPRKLTVVVALSAVPLGITGHTGVAIDERYWDFGPDRVSSKQHLQSIGSPGGPWWDDPDQRWQRDRTLTQVLDDLPELVHPEGSVVVIFTAWITEEEARTVERYWDERYLVMHNDAMRYEITHRQCASVGCHSLGGVARMPGFLNLTPDPTDLPPQLRVMSPTMLAAYLRLKLRHTAGPNAGQRAEVEWLQLRDGAMVAYEPLVLLRSRVD